ncbi:hypothetical protein DCAR_0522104 [Daucus carota subsp. sativus]|uniref:Myb-like domain-containing protein n=1 Tax=Daucus carota subsp. sativus TaxID=79200 RepID=A0AAF0X7A1_DAUCS|nr:PREDICTED: uncharacterized protein LOC108223693 [Daucus carota subsp. sativus]WOH02715.1 hypothetical protein DCAR_0522104 [Daucus carota subsp. sativus]
MIENTKKRKRGFISEEDIAIVLQRYSPTTVLALLQELSRVADEKFDWNEMVRKTSTGISNPREYQMLWRRLAYNTSLVEVLDEEVEPLDDDSDLDYEIEALPNVTPEASAEAVACVKVLAASGMPSSSTVPNGSTVEAPLTIKIPSGQAARVSSESLHPSSFVRGRTNITVPVSVQKQPTSTEGLDTDGLAGGNPPPRRRRKPWSAAEDLELIAAVKKCGEGNWANILKGDFKSERSASQLSQRWNIIRKRKGNSNLGRNSQLSEAQLAARRAVSLALNMPMTDKLKASFSSGSTSLAIMPSNSIHCDAETSAGIKSEPQSEVDSLPTVTPRSNISYPDSVPTIAQRSGILGPAAKQDLVKTATQQSIAAGVSSKARINLKAQSMKHSPGPDGELVKAAAVAAGARIATPSDAASLLRAAQAKNAVRIMPAGGASVGAGSGNSLPSNVHYIRTGLATTFSTYSTVPPSVSRSTSSQHIQGHSVKQAIVQGIQSQRHASPKLNVSSERNKAVTSGPVIKIEANILENVIPKSVDASQKPSQEDEDSDRGCTMREKERNHFGNPGQAQRQVGDGGPEEKIKKDQDLISSGTLLALTSKDLAKPVPVSHQSDTANSKSLRAEVSGDGDCIDNNQKMGFSDKEKYVVDVDICEDHNVGKKID